MTDHADLSKSLALALGWEDVYPVSLATWKHPYVMVSEGVVPRGQMMQWRMFDYRDPTVCLPLIEWLMREYGGFFTRDVIGPHQVWYLPRCFPGMPDRSYPTLAEAVAKACIAVNGGG